MQNDKKLTTDRLYLMIGLAAVALSNAVFFILKGNVVIPVRDQLDGEIAAYILNAKHFLSGSDYLPEYLGGGSRTILVPPSCFSVLFFCVFPTLYAFLANNLFMMLFAFAGMFLWANALTKNRVIAFFVGLLYAYIPFASVYGLARAGMPLAAWSFYSLAQEKEKKTGYILPFLFIALYGLSSSLVLCGYAVLAVCGGVFVWLLIKRFRKAAVLRFFSGILLLSLVYILENAELILQVLGIGNGFVSHKSEYVLADAPFFETFKSVLWHGNMILDMNREILVEIALVFLIFAVVWILGKVKKIGVESDNSSVKILSILSGFGLLTAAFSAFWQTKPVRMFLNSRKGSLKAFQADRFTWLLPFVWFSALAVVCIYLYRLSKKKVTGILLVALALLPCAKTVLMGSTFKENAMELVRKDSNALTWDGFFCEDELRAVASYLETERGLKQSEYRVGCLGIEPAVAIYNGFYTIDGYSNNYDVEYKHRFRKIIAKELEKNDYNRSYYDDWGNRCYLLSSEYYGNPFLSKYASRNFNDLELDTEALKDVGCDYILAAGEIAGAEEKGFNLLKVFDNVAWTYYIYLYEVR